MGFCGEGGAGKWGAGIAEAGEIWDDESEVFGEVRDEFCEAGGGHGASVEEDDGNCGCGGWRSGEDVAVGDGSFAKRGEGLGRGWLGCDRVEDAPEV